MTITFFTSLNDKGISDYSNNLVNAIREGDIRHEYNIKVVGLEEVFRIFGNIKKYINARRLFKILGNEMNEGDIAHIQYESSLFCLWTNPLEFMYPRFRKQINIPTILTVHELEERKKSRKWYLNMIKSIYYVVLSKYVHYVNVGIFKEADALIVHTEETKKRLLERGVGEEKINIIEPGINMPEFSNNSCDVDKMKYNLEGKTVITTFGYISNRKGQDFVIEMLPHIKEEVVYLIAGKALNDEPFKSYYEGLKDRIQELKLEDRVILTGYVSDEDVKYIMNATDIIVTPSRDITASGSISIALSFNKVILSSNLGFVKEINDNIECIEVYEKEDKTSFLNSLNMLLENRDRRDFLASNVSEFVKSRSYSIITKKTIDVYERVYKESKQFYSNNI